ncbi:MAG: glycosyltransferase family 39 protein [Syntrophobacteraceae bacterium]
MSEGNRARLPIGVREDAWSIAPAASPDVVPVEASRWGWVWPAGLILLLWSVIIVLVDPRGGFMVNDDWSFVRSLEALRQGRLIATGWGPEGAPGGPSLIVHLLWGWLFSALFGFSMTSLRASVLAMGVVGSMSLLLLLRSSKIPVWLALLATLTLILNPLFLSQSFSFMTDVTFTGLAASALLALHLGMEKGRVSWLCCGLLLITASILTRQIGIVLAVAFVAVCWLTPRGRRLGPWSMTVLAVALTVVPWLGWELSLSLTGSTPITQHQVFAGIFGRALQKGLPDYLVFLSSQIFQVALSYVAFLLAPLLMLQLAGHWRIPAVRKALVVYAVLAALFESAVLAGMIHPPVALYGNVIVNLGIGPLLFKDTYLLGLARLAALPVSAYYGVVLVTLPLMVVLVHGILASLRRLLAQDGSPPIASVALLSALMYLGIVALAGARDRYLIPLCLLLTVWMVLDRSPAQWGALKPGKSLAAALVALGLTGAFSVAGSHDFMATRRAAQEAHDHLLVDLKVDPCQVDGGFEFNGYYCYDPHFRPEPGLSWWWVHREDYLTTLGTLPGYEVTATFPFGRWMGPDGAVYLLKPTPQLARPGPL